MAGFVTGVTLATPLLFCLAPVVSTLHSAVADQLRGGGRTSTQTKHQLLAIAGAVTVQFSLAFVLLASAGLLVRSLIKASEANPGFRPEHVLSLRISLPGTIYGTPALRTSFFDRLLSRMSALPGIQQTGAISNLPMDSTSNRFISARGHGPSGVRVDAIFCAGDTLESLRVLLLRGRLLQPADRLRKQPVVVISETVAKRIWPHDNPIGRHIKFGADVAINDSPWLTVVGVVGDIKDHLTSNSPRPVVFTMPEDWVSEMNLVARISGDPLSLASAIRREVKHLDPSLPIEKMETIDQVLDHSLAAERFRTWLLICFASAALLLAMLGIAGVLAYNTAQRAQEFGVRIALGANRRHLLVLVFRHCLRLSGTGIVVGLALSLLVTRALSALLYDTSPLDPGTFVAVPSILAIVALGAAMFPAWRAVHTDPITTLRAE